MNEAFAAQCPVIASNTTSVLEVTGDAAWSVPPSSTESISAAMFDVLQQSNEREYKTKAAWHAPDTTPGKPVPSKPWRFTAILAGTGKC
ncbi:hypothetical protein D3C76_1622850 [compost metagenome]